MYKRMKRMVKRMVRESKKRVIENWTLSIADNFKENKRKFWKGVNEARKEGSGIIRPGLENDGIGKKVYVVFCVGSRIVGQVQMR